MPEPEASSQSNRRISEAQTFQFVFYLDGNVYEYGFSLDRRQIHEEWLMQLTEAGFAPLFTRVTDELAKTEIDIESKFAHKKSKERVLAEVLKESIRENQKNQLFLYKLHDNGMKKAERIVEWFKNLQIIFPETKVRALPIRMKDDTALQDYIGEMLRKWIRVFLMFLSQVRKLDEESDGTQRLPDLLPMLFAMRENNHAIYFVDEIDRSLHTKLSQYLLNEFIHCCENTYNQIIFTAHDVNLINTNDFRQEEIWFIEKSSLGESHLHPLSDFNLQKGQDTGSGKITY